MGRGRAPNPRSLPRDADPRDALTRFTTLLLLSLAACTAGKAGSDSAASADGADGGSDGAHGGGDGAHGGGDGADGGTGDPMTDNLLSQSGDFATDYLSADTHTSLLIEVDYVTGHQPEGAAMDGLVTSLERTLDKPGGVTWELSDELPSQGDPVWTVQQTEDIEVANRDRYHDAASGQAVISITYLDGTSDQDPDGGGYVIAYAYHGSSIIMFGQRVDPSGSSLPLAGSVEETILIHEVGHLLGLVDNGIDMVSDHRDEEHGSHDDNEDCIMYWAINSANISDLLLSAQPNFDAACQADMQAACGLRR